jgi:arylsulfatase A-like enzyme
MTDDQRTDGTLDVMPATRDWFGQGGTSFPLAAATTPLCCPSRATVFSGRYAHNHGVVGNHHGANLNQNHTLQRHLEEAGYRTAIFGKYFNGWDLRRNPPIFDEWAINRRAYTRSWFNINGTVKRVKGYGTTFIKRRALGFLRRSEQHDDQPWLMFVTPFAPHVPAQAEPAYRNAPVPRWEGNPAVDEADRSDKPPFIQSVEDSPQAIESIRVRQLRTLMSVDDLVADLTSELRLLGEEETTLAFFLSDNGFTWGEHGRIGKATPYTASMEIPFYVRWPGRIAPGAVDWRRVTTVDIAPTILQAAGIDAEPGRLDGRSLLEQWDRDRLLTESWFPAWASTRTPTFQYTEWYDQSGQVVFRELYDLVRDPWQLENLFAQSAVAGVFEAGELDALTRQLASDRECAGVAGPASCP